jgi:hypothetical protein
MTFQLHMLYVLNGMMAVNRELWSIQSVSGLLYHSKALLEGRRQGIFLKHCQTPTNLQCHSSEDQSHYTSLLFSNLSFHHVPCVRLPRCLTKQYATNTCGRLDAILSLAVNGGDSFMLQMLYCLYTVEWGRGLGGPHGQSGCGSEEKNT